MSLIGASRLPLEILRCPTSGDPLILVESGELATPSGAHSYPVIDGIPVLLRSQHSVIGVGDLVRSDPASGSFGRARTVAANAARTVLRMPPTFSREAVSRDNFRRLGLILEERARKGGVQHVLVVGGATVGMGFEPLLNSPATDIIETDIAHGPRTRIICDGHDLPFGEGVFDAVVCQAVLEHVLDPVRVVSEIHRVLAPDGLVYSEVPFMQQVHEGAHDVTRFTLLGHRRLYRYFDEIASGAQGGPGMALAWSIRYFLMAFAPSRAARALVTRLVTLLFFWLKYCDAYLGSRPGGIDAASGTYFLGRRREVPVPDREILRGYRGDGPRAAMLERT